MKKINNWSATAFIAPLFAVILLSSPVSGSSEIFGISEIAEAIKGFRPVSQAASATLTPFVVIGEVNCPGEFELAAPVNLLTALLAAGGPTSAGSMRHIKVYKDKDLLGEFDLYDFLRQDRINSDFVFNGGEEVVIPPVGPQIKISGQILRPGIFEMKPDNLQLATAVELTGGFSDVSMPHRIEILRSIGGYRRVFLAIEVVPGEKLPQMQLIAGDEINVTKITSETPVIILEGQVTPGKIACQEGLRLSEILTKTVKFGEDASLDYAEVLRAGASGGNYEVIGFSPAALLSGNNAGDITMRPGDRLMIFSKQLLDQKPLVFIEGLVKKPGMCAYEKGMTIEKLIKEAGGILNSQSSNLFAELSRREIKDGRLDFTCIEINLKAALSEDPRHNLILKPFDSLRIVAP